MGAALSIALAAGTAGLSWPDTGIFRAGVAVGYGLRLVTDALDSVYDAAERVMDYVRSFSSACECEKAKKKAEAFVKVVNDGVVKPVRDKVSSAMEDLRRAVSSAYEKLKAAKEFVTDKVLKLVRRLFGRKEAAAAKDEVDRAAAADQDAGHDVLSRASGRVAGSARALPPPLSSAIVSATAPGGALTLQGSVAAPAARAARRASEMMALLGTVDAGSIPEDARSCIYVVVAAAGIGLEATAAAAAATKDT